MESPNIHERMIWKHIGEEIRDGKTAVCATLNMDHSGLDQNNMIANRIYEDCRGGRLSIPSFPNFQPLVSALKAGQNSDRTTSYRVSSQRHDQLLVLETYAKKWTESEFTAERAKAVIQEHNSEFNNSGDYWIPERTIPPIVVFVFL